jgi:hypothetical protein
MISLLIDPRCGRNPRQHDPHPSAAYSDDGAGCKQGSPQTSADQDKATRKATLQHANGAPIV